MRSDLKKLDSFTLEMSKNHLIRIFLRNGRLRVNIYLKWSYIFTRSATSYGEFSLYSQKSAPSGLVSQKSRSFAIRVLTPDFRKRPCCFILVRRRYWSAYCMHWGKGSPYFWTFLKQILFFNRISNIIYLMYFIFCINFLNFEVTLRAGHRRCLEIFYWIQI